MITPAIPEPCEDSQAHIPVFHGTHTYMRMQYECEDIQGDAALFEALGVGLGRAEMTDIALAAKRLGQDPRRGVATVRCVGR